MNDASRLESDTYRLSPPVLHYVGRCTGFGIFAVQSRNPLTVAALIRVPAGIRLRLLDLQLHIPIAPHGSALAGIPRRRNLD